jgi:adenosyl cobinamide kinase/adenosyl cobinamide phosphate guanylyltransferase
MNTSARAEWLRQPLTRQRCRCVVRTTAEILLGLLPEYRFSREHDDETGILELMISPVSHA